MTGKPDNANLINELVALLRLTRTEAHIARIRTAQAQTDDIRAELEENAREADLRAEELQRALRRLGGIPDALADVVGYVTALTKGTAEQAQPFSEGLLGDLALEHQMLDRVVFARVLAEARNETAVADLMRRLEADHTETIDWLHVRLAEVAQGGPVALAPTPAQAMVGTVARLATLPVRQSAGLINRATELLRRGQDKAGAAVETTWQKTQATTRAAGEVAEAGRDAALARAEQAAPYENVRTIARETRKSLGTIEPEALPVADYDELSGADAIAQVKALQEPQDVRVVLAYEQAHKARKGVTSAAEKRLTELAAEALTS